MKVGLAQYSGVLPAHSERDQDQSAFMVSEFFQELKKNNLYSMLHGIPELDNAHWSSQILSIDEHSVTIHNTFSVQNRDTPYRTNHDMAELVDKLADAVINQIRRRYGLVAEPRERREVGDTIYRRVSTLSWNSGGDICIFAGRRQDGFQIHILAQEHSPAYEIGISEFINRQFLSESMDESMLREKGLHGILEHLAATAPDDRIELSSEELSFVISKLWELAFMADHLNVELEGDSALAANAVIVRVLDENWKAFSVHLKARNGIADDGSIRLQALMETLREYTPPSNR